MAKGLSVAARSLSLQSIPGPTAGRYLEARLSTGEACAVITRSIRIASTGGSFDALLVQPDAQPRPTIVVLHEEFSVNSGSREALLVARFAAIFPDLFWRQRKGMHMYEAYDVDAGVRDVEATVAAARMLGGTGRAGVMGFGLGGLLTFLTAARTRVDVAVAFDGGRTEEFLGEAPDVDAPLQMHLAEENEFMTTAAQRQIIKALADHPRVEIHTYPGRHDAVSREGIARALEFFNRHL
jgi:carboxymethylenebutenolidase